MLIKILRFQFHTVQLKHCLSVSVVLNFGVSIPYGTIKTGIPHQRCRAYLVSIPYGTIKTFSPMNPFGFPVMFQFHTVQLKLYTANIQQLISWFQFHTVQLKLTGFDWNSNGWTFQFHTVQLKPAFFLYKVYPHFVSIPYGTIKTMR